MISAARAERIAMRCEAAHKEIDARHERALQYAKEQAKRKHQKVIIEGEFYPVEDVGSYLPQYKFPDYQPSKKESED